MKMPKKFVFSATYKFVDPLVQDVKEIIVEHDEIHTDKLAWQYGIMRAFEERKSGSYLSNFQLIKTTIGEEG